MFNETTLGLGGTNFTLAGMGFDYSFGFTDPGGGANPSDPYSDPNSPYFGMGPSGQGPSCPSGQVYISGGIPGCYGDPGSIGGSSPPSAGSTMPQGAGPDGIDWGSILQQGLTMIPATISSALGHPYAQNYPGAGGVASSVYNPYQTGSVYPSSQARPPVSSGLGFNISSGTLMIIVVVVLAMFAGGARRR
jgi:hypothetical protein